MNDLPVQQITEAASGNIYLAIAAIIYMVIFAFMPTLIAITRGHKFIGWIFVYNLVLGITGIGWFAALIWSLNTDTKEN